VENIGRSAHFAAIAAELEAEGRSLEALAIRLETLSKTQQKYSKWFSDDWPDDVKISYDLMNNRMRSAKDAFTDNIDAYPDQAKKWMDTYTDPIYGNYGFGSDSFKHFLHFQTNAKLLLKCAAIAAAKAKEYAGQPDYTSITIGEINRSKKEFNEMGDTNVNTGVAGALGRGATATGNFMSQSADALKNIDMGALRSQLERLRTEMKSKGSTAEHDEAVGEIAKAEKAAKNSPIDSKGVLDHLRAAGAWALDVAKDIGVDVAKDAIQKSLGLGV
jgi:hypothetical protein